MATYKQTSSGLARLSEFKEFNRLNSIGLIIEVSSAHSVCVWSWHSCILSLLAETSCDSRRLGSSHLIRFAPGLPLHWDS